MYLYTAAEFPFMINLSDRYCYCPHVGENDTAGNTCLALHLESPLHYLPRNACSRSRFARCVWMLSFGLGNVFRLAERLVEIAAHVCAALPAWLTSTFFEF